MAYRRANDYDEEARNVSDYSKVKDALFTEYYDFLRNVNTYQTPAIQRRPREYEQIRHALVKNAFFIANLGGASKNITKEDVESLQEYIEYMRHGDEEYTEELRRTEALAMNISKSMGVTGFLDTRLTDDEETVDSDDLKNFYLDRKPAIYDN